MIKKHYQKELGFKDFLKEGDFDEKVGAVQELIYLRRYYDPKWNYRIEVDDDYGTLTKKAVLEFQRFYNIKPDDGVVGLQTWERLIEPIKDAYDINPDYKNLNLGERVVKYAEQHLDSCPRELPGNMGIWVRCYMEGNEGKVWAWCAGFATTIIDQACEQDEGKSLTDVIQLNVWEMYSCDNLLKWAKDNNKHIPSSDLKSKGTKNVKPGDLFLVINKNNPDDARHVGVISEIGDGYFTTIEGNTNDEGSREGYEVCKRIRNYNSNSIIDVVQV